MRYRKYFYFNVVNSYSSRFKYETLINKNNIQELSNVIERIVLKLFLRGFILVLMKAN